MCMLTCTLVSKHDYTQHTPKGQSGLNPLNGCLSPCHSIPVLLYDSSLLCILHLIYHMVTSDYTKLPILMPASLSAFVLQGWAAVCPGSLRMLIVVQGNGRAVHQGAGWVVLCPKLIWFYQIFYGLQLCCRGQSNNCLPARTVVLNLWVSSLSGVK